MKWIVSSRMNGRGTWYEIGIEEKKWFLYFEKSNALYSFVLDLDIRVTLMTTLRGHKNREIQPLLLWVEK